LDILHFTLEIQMSMSAKKNYGWAGMVIGVLALVIVPFMIWGERVDEWTGVFLETAHGKPLLVVSVLGGLLASDILFPVPSSIVSTGCGMLLGLTVGALTSLAGMVVSCGIGYWLGRICGRPMAVKMCGEKELDRFEAVSDKFGLWALVIARPVPVLAEVSVLFAGVSKISFSRFMFVTSLSNLGVSLVYAGIGAYADEWNSFLLAFFAGICVPGIIMLLARGRISRR
jgi:uncharacterized membrane protein YdjX (TVP38/TMEM64 family)